MSPTATRPSYENFWRRVTGDGKAPCALAGISCYRCHGVGFHSRLDAGQVRSISCSRCRGTGVMRCSPGKPDAHHFIPKRRLQTDRAKVDVRNGVCLCRDHHEMVEQGLVLSPRPPFLTFFVHDHDVPEHLIPRARTAAARRGRSST